MKPLMTDQDVKLVEKELLKFNPIDVLEWGSGGSTIYFSNFIIDKIGLLNLTWESIEYDLKWYLELVYYSMPQVRLHLFDEEVLRNDDRRALRNKPMNEYVLFPKKLGKKYDVIFVDGRKRRRCLLEALELLKPGGIVLLHDAGREYYHCAMEKYNGQFLSKTLWKGTLKSQ